MFLFKNCYKAAVTSLFCLFFFVSGYGQVQTGKASFYAKSFSGRTTANGEKYNPKKFTAAHRHLPFGTKVRVTNIANNKSVIVRINDRGPYISGRIIDLSLAAAKKLGFTKEGITDVAITVVDKNTSTKQKAKKIVKSSTQKPVIHQKTPSDSSIKKETTPSTSKTQFYQITTSQTIPKGYGVQIGSFEEAAYLLKLVDQLKKDFSKQVHIAIKTIDKTKIYSVIVGQFTSHQKAESFKKTVQKKYKGAFVVNLAQITS